MMTSDFIVEQLVDSCNNNNFPKNKECLNCFMFDRCRNLTECSNLLNLYIGLVKLPDFQEDELKRAINTKNLVNYIINMYKDKPNTFYKWFKFNILKFLF